MKQVKIFLLAAITVMGLSMCSENKKSAVAEDEPVDSCAVMPEFPGGQEALMAFINDNIKYPTQAVEVGLEGRVVCDFIIEKDGSVNNVKVAESADSLLDAEAVRVLNSMSAWTPGQNVPVTFMLDGTRDQVEQQPEFPGGMEAYLDFMAKNIKYPAECEKNGVEGRVLVDVVIDEEGNVTEPKVKKSVDPLLDAEALRVVKMMPKWTPGMNEGKAVKVLYTVPFTFRLK